MDQIVALLTGLLSSFSADAGETPTETPTTTE